MRPQTIPGAWRLEDLCRCDGALLEEEVSAEELEELLEEDADIEPCEICGGRVVMPRQYDYVREEEEDDC